MQDWRQQLSQINFANYAPMGRVASYSQAAARKALSPDSIRAGAQAFERQVAMERRKNALLAIRAKVFKEAEAAKMKSHQQFQKVWPEGMSEKLINNFATRKRR